MREGDEVKLYRQGLRLSPKQAAALGTPHDGECWGLWVNGHQGTDLAEFKQLAPGGTTLGHQGPHLVVSPIHPNKWPAAFSLTVRIRRAPGTLRSLLERIAERNINVLFMNSAIAGYDLAIVRMICELPAWSSNVHGLLSELQENQKESDPDALRGRRISLMRKIGQVNVAIAAMIVSDLIVYNQSLLNEAPAMESYIPSPVPFLHERTLTIGLNPWFCQHSMLEFNSLSKLLDSCGLGNWSKGNADRLPPLQEIMLRRWEHLDTLNPDENITAKFGLTEYEVKRRASGYRDRPDEGPNFFLREIWRANGVEPVVVKGLISLAYSRIWARLDAKNGPDFIQLKYDAVSRLLSPVGNSDSTGSFRETIQNKLIEIGKAGPREFDEPATVLAHFNHEEKSVRLRFLRGEFSRKYALQVDVEYFWKHAEDKYSYCSSKGLVACILRSVHRNNLTVERVENSITSSGEFSESGRIRFVMSAISIDDELGFMQPEVRKRLEYQLRGAVKAAVSNHTIEPTTVNIMILPLSDGFDRRPI
jgi:hypothetical protein